MAIKPLIRPAAALTPKRRKPQEPGLSVEERGLLKRLGGAAWNTFLVFANTVDTPQQIIRSTWMWLETQDPDRFDDIFKAMIPFKRKFGVGEEELPTWEEILEEYGFEEGLPRTLTALAIGITGDFMLIPSILGLPARFHKAGFRGMKAAEVVTKFPTWATQAEAGQRIVLYWPYLSKLMGTEVGIQGKSLVTGVASFGRKIAHPFERALGASKVGTKVVKAVEEAGASAEEAADLMAERAGWMRTSIAAKQSKVINEPLLAKEGAELIGGEALYMQPVHKPGFSAAIDMGKWAAADDLVRMHASVAQGVARQAMLLGKAARPEKGLTVMEALQPIIDAMSKSIKRTIESGDEVFDFLSFGPGGGHIAQDIATKTSVPFKTIKELLKLDLKGVHIGIVQPLVGPVITKKTMGRFLKKLDKAGATYTMYGLGYATEEIATLPFTNAQMLAQRAEIGMLSAIYGLHDDVEELNAVRKGLGEDYMRVLADFSQSKEKLAALSGKPIAELDNLEKIVRYLRSETEDGIAWARAMGLPVADFEATSVKLAYTTRVFTPRFLKWWGNVLKSPKFKEVFGQLSDVNGVTPKDLMRKYALHVKEYTPWKKLTPQVRRLAEELLGVDDEVLTLAKSTGLSAELLSMFSDAGMFHHSMISRNPLFGEMTWDQLNVFFKELGAPKAVVDDVFMAHAIRKSRDMKIRNVVEAMHEAAERFGIPLEKPVTRAGKEVIEAVDVPKGMREVPVINNMRARMGLGRVGFEPGVANALQGEWDFAFNANPSGDLYRWYMSALRWWKGWTLYPWPAYHARNIMSDMWIAKVYGGMTMHKMPEYMGLGKKILKSGRTGMFVTGDGSKVPWEEMRSTLHKMHKSTFGYTAAAMDDVLSYADPTEPFRKTGYIEQIREAWRGAPTVKGKIGAAAEFIWKPEKFPIGYFGREIIAKNWEMGLRNALFLDQVYKGSTTKEAANWVLQVFGDFSAIGRREKKIMGAIFPFWSWTRINTPRTISGITGHPWVYDSIVRVQQASQQAFGEEELEALPAWIREQPYLRIPTTEAEIPLYLTQLGLPEDDVFRLMSFNKGAATPLRRAISMFAPLPKMIIELAANKNMFFDAPITDYKRGFGYLDVLPDEVKSWIGFHKYTDGKGRERFIMNPYALYMMSQFRAFTMLHRATDERKEIGMRMLNLFTGMKVSSIDIEFFARKRLKDELYSVLKDAEARGLVGKGEYYYKSPWVNEAEMPEDVKRALEIIR